MKIDLSQKLKTGIFVTAGIGILIVIIFLIGSQKNLFTKTFSVHANFKNVAGLQIGNIVRFAGINVGTVDDIIILNDSIVQVSFRLQSSIKKYIKQDAIANIGSDGLMGDKIIQISSGTFQTALVKENSLIIGQDPINMDQVMGKLNAIATNAEIFTNNLAGIVKKVNGGEGSLGRLLNNDQLARNLEGTVSSTEATVKSIKKSADGFSDNMQAVKSNFLLRGYFKKKEKKRIADSTKNAQLKTTDTLKTKGILKKKS
jgi:phospholipid/cholesterol/gamma-HCH transport system substrate-binding protein